MMSIITIDRFSDPVLTDKEFVVLFKENYIHQDFNKLRLTNERAEGVFELAKKIGGDDHKLSGIYLRASLGEFVSMEETLIADLPGQSPLKLNQINNTLLHILRELRNFQVHLKNVDLNYNSSEATIINERDPNFSLGPFSTKLTVVDNLNVQELKKLHNIKKYYTDDGIKHMINWLNSAQKEYSIQTLVLKGLKFYTTELARHHGLSVV
jgi:hypothetical protein